MTPDSVSIADETKPPIATRPRPARRRAFLAAALAAALVAAGIGGWTWWRGDAGGQGRIVTAQVERGTIEDAVTALGTLQPLEYVDVGTQVSGQLRKIHVEIGATVKEGELLAEIDPTVYQARVDADRAQLLNLKAQLADKEAQLILAQQQFKRESSLMKAKATSEGAYENAEATLRSATAQVEALKAQIQNTESVLKGDETNLGFTKIRAPMSGTVVTQIAKQGQTLNANQQAPIVMRIADLSVMTVWTQVSEADIGRLRIGMDAYFTTLGQPDRRWTGKLRKILPSPEIVNNVVLYDALFDVPNPTGELLTQMSAQVFFVTARAKDVVLVPLAALKPLAGRTGKKGNKRADGDSALPKKEEAAPAGDAPKPRRYKVQVLNTDGKPEDRVVTVGLANRVSAQILSGLVEGERVVVGAPRAGRSSKERRPARRPKLS